MHVRVADAGTLERSGRPGEVWEAEAAHRGSVAKRGRDKARAGARAAAAVSNDPYDILGVRRSATTREIRAAYLHLVKELHPDGRTPDGKDPDEREADERLKAINEAYHKLKVGGSTGRRGWARGTSAIFAVGVLTSAVPMLLLLGTYYGAWTGSRVPAASTAAAPESNGALAMWSVHSKDHAVGRQLAFADAKKRGTKAAWSTFLAAFPDGEPAANARQAIAAIELAEAAQARRRAERAAWIAAEKGKRKELQRFIATFPDGEHMGSAKLALAAVERKEQAAWIAAERSGTQKGYLGFLEEHPDSPQVAKARQALAAIASAEARVKADLEAWAKAAGDGSKAALHQYLAEHPAGRHAAEATKRVALLEAKQKEHEAWVEALQHNNRAAYTRYLTAYPNGLRVADARQRIAGLEHSEARMQEARADLVKAPPVRPRPPAVAAKEEPFIGADGRIRR